MQYHVLDDLAGEIVRVNLEMLKKKTKITHAWALTIHKFQGSESETIVYGLSGSNHETWKHVYTAVTRGRKSVVIVGSFDDLKKAVKKKPLMRQTALREKVRKLLTKIEKEKEMKKEDGESKLEKDKVKLEKSAQDSNQTKISHFYSPSKVKVENKENVSTKVEPVTPNKLSQELADSLKFSSKDDEWMSELSEDFDDDNCAVAISPIKRKGSDTQNSFSPPKLLKESSSSIVNKKLLVCKELEFATSTQVSKGKRPAFESPATLKTSCRIESPRSYPPGTSSRQPEPDIMDDSFGDVDCSLVEHQAIISSQRKNMADVFGSDDEDDFGDDDGISDDELASLVRYKVAL